MGRLGVVYTSSNQDFGQATRDEDISIRAFIASIGLSVCIWLSGLATFLCLQNRRPELFQPQCQVREIPSLPQASIGSLKQIWQIPQSLILKEYGLDAYLMDRFLRKIISLFLAQSLLILPLLMPLNVVYGRTVASTGMKLLSWQGQIQSRFYLMSHVFAVLAVSSSMYFFLFQEMSHVVYQRRIQLLRAPDHYVFVRQAQGDLPSHYNYGGQMSDYCWLMHSRDERDLRDKYDIAHQALEKVLAERVAAAHRRILTGNVVTAETVGVEDILGSQTYDTCLPIRLKTLRLPGSGNRVNIIEYYGRKMQKLREEYSTLRQMAATERTSELSLVMRFKDRFSAYLAAQTRTTLQSAVACLLEVYSATEVNWRNLSYDQRSQLLRQTLSRGMAIAAIVVGTLPASIASCLAQLTALAELSTWLRWIQKLPVLFVGLIQGSLPQLIAAVLLIMNSRVMQQLVALGRPESRCEEFLSLQKYFFWGQYIHNFVVPSITTVSLGIAWSAATNDLLHIPLSTAQLCAYSLPKASNYFLSYLPLQTSINSTLLFSGVLTMLRLRIPRFKAPRQAILEASSAPFVTAATRASTLTALTCIVTSFSVFCPLILPLATICFVALRFCTRYAILYVEGHTNASMGLAYAQMLRHILAGVYPLQLCMLGPAMFLLKDGNSPSFWATIIAAVPVCLTYRVGLALNELSQPMFSCPGSDPPAESSQPQLSASLKELGGFDCEIWLPKDDLGIAQQESERLTKRYAHLGLHFLVVDSDSH